MRVCCLDCAAVPAARLDRRLDEEVQAHLEQLAADYEARD